MPTVTALLTILILLLGVGLSISCWFWWHRGFSPIAKRIERRLDASRIELERAPLLLQSAKPAAEQSIAARNERSEKMLRYCAAAGITLQPWQLLAIAALYLLTVIFGGLLSPLPLLLTLIFTAALLLAPVGYIRRRHAQNAARFDRQLPEALEVMARSLQAGKSIVSCWREMSEVLPEPLGPICRDIFLKLSYGGDLDDILREAATRIPSDDVRFFFTALNIQAKSGGNMVALLQSQAELMRERLALKERIRALSSESRMSAWIMGLMPFVTTVLMLLISPKTMSLLWTTPAGVKMVEFGLLMQLLGALWISRLVSIKV